jgi:hypothetical protein
MYRSINCQACGFYQADGSAIQRTRDEATSIIATTTRLIAYIELTT